MEINEFSRETWEKSIKTIFVFAHSSWRDLHLYTNKIYMFLVLICIQKVASGIYRHYDGYDGCDGCDVSIRANIAVVTNISMTLISSLVIRDSVGKGGPRFLDGCQHGDHYEDCSEHDDNHKVHTENELPHTRVLSGKYSKWNFVCVLMFVIWIFLTWWPSFSIDLYIIYRM